MALTANCVGGKRGKQRGGGIIPLAQGAPVVYQYIVTPAIVMPSAGSVIHRYFGPRICDL